MESKLMFNSDISDIGALADPYRVSMQRHTVLTPPTFTPTKEQVEALAADIGKEQSTVLPGFTNDQVENMKAFAANLRRKYPKMKGERVARKVREHFKIKLDK